MNRFCLHHLVLSTLFLAATSVFSQNTTPPASAGQPSPEEQTILQLERELSDAYTMADAKTFERLLADDLTTIITNTGRVRTRERYLTGMNMASEADEKREILDMTARVWGNTAVATGLLVYTRKKLDGVATRYARVTDTFLKREKGWQVVASHFSPVLWWQVRTPEDKQLTVLKPLPCTQEASLRSVEGTTQVYMKTTNRTDKPIVSQFIGLDGKRHPTNKVTIEPGQSRDVYTFLGTSFIVTDTTGKCLSLYQPIAQPGLVVIK